MAHLIIGVIELLMLNFYLFEMNTTGTDRILKYTTQVLPTGESIGSYALQINCH